jgi:hypothetical protein
MDDPDLEQEPKDSAEKTPWVLILVLVVSASVFVAISLVIADHTPPNYVWPDSKIRNGRYG